MPQVNAQAHTGRDLGDSMPNYRKMIKIRGYETYLGECRINLNGPITVKDGFLVLFEVVEHVGSYK